jgi:GT2 family glycosyltransferase
LASLPTHPTEPGISLVIPSRNGKALLAAQMPGIARELPKHAEIIVVDNGSQDGTAEWLRESWPRVEIEVSEAPLSFAEAVNRGINRSRRSQICLLNNDMLLEPGFFTALAHAFEAVPELFSATAQIRFPEGVRREETGKAVMAQAMLEDFPIRCDEPIAGEDLTYVLYGSGGCSLFDAAKLRALGGADESYAPAYVEDLDLGYRAWQRGWPSVYVAGAVVEHRHRATTARYYTAEQLDAILERNYLKFLARAVFDASLFRRLWTQAIRRLRMKADHQSLREAVAIVLAGGPRLRPRCSEALVLALTNGAVCVFPGRAPAGRPRMLIASPDLRRCDAMEFDQVLVAFSVDTAAPPAQVLEACVEVVVVRSNGSDAAASFRAALQQTIRKWQPAAARLVSKQMAQYAEDCAPARIKFVEEETP